MGQVAREYRGMINGIRIQAFQDMIHGNGRLFAIYASQPFHHDMIEKYGDWTDILKESIFTPAGKDEIMQRKIDYVTSNPSDIWINILDPDYRGNNLTDNMKKFFKGTLPENIFNTNNEAIYDIVGRRLPNDLLLVDEFDFGPFREYSGIIDGHKIYLIDFGSYYDIYTDKIFDKDFILKYAKINESIFKPASSEELKDRFLQYYEQHKDNLWEKYGEFSRHRRLTKFTQDYFKNDDIYFSKMKVTPKFLKYFHEANDSPYDRKKAIIDEYKILMQYYFDQESSIWSNKPFDIEFIKKYF
jgi:hypothetical protein